MVSSLLDACVRAASVLFPECPSYDCEARQTRHRGQARGTCTQSRAVRLVGDGPPRRDHTWRRPVGVGSAFRQKACAADTARVGTSCPVIIVFCARRQIACGFAGSGRNLDDVGTQGVRSRAPSREVAASPCSRVGPAPCAALPLRRAARGLRRPTERDRVVRMRLLSRRPWWPQEVTHLRRRC